MISAEKTPSLPWGALMIRYLENICRLSALAALIALVGCSSHHYVGSNRQGVVFFLEYPGAEEVAFASSTDDFQLRQAHRDQQGRWLVEGLKSEDFQYFYLVDGKPFVPDCRYRQQDDFGSMNCVYLP